MARYRRSARGPVILTPDGRVLRGLSATAERNIDETLGGKLFRWMNPEQERAEYEGMGLEAPAPTTFSDVRETAIIHAQEAAGQAFDFSSKAVKALLIAGGIAAALYAVHLFVAVKKVTR